MRTPNIFCLFIGFYLFTTTLFAQEVKIKNDTAIVYNDVNAAIEYSNKDFKVAYVILNGKEKSLPKDFSKIKAESLFALFCDNCSLESLPNLSKFKNLSFVEISWFMTGDPPPNKKVIDQVLNLKYLKDLTITGFILDSNIKIKSKELKRLDLSDTELNAFPEAIFSLSKLKILKLGCNEIKTIPAEIENLKSLEYLSFNGGFCGGNPIETISPNIRRLSRLENLLFSGGNLKNVPIEIFKLPRLKYLSFHYCKIESFPEITSGGILKSFNLNAGSELKAFPKSFSRLRLNRLNINIHEPSLGVVKTRKVMENMEPRVKDYDVSIGKKSRFPGPVNPNDLYLFGMWEVIPQKSSGENIRFMPEIEEETIEGAYLYLSGGRGTLSSSEEGAMNSSFKFNRIGNHLTGVLSFAASIEFMEEYKGYEFYFDCEYNASTKELKITNSAKQVYYLKKVD